MSHEEKNHKLKKIKKKIKIFSDAFPPDNTGIKAIEPISQLHYLLPNIIIIESKIIYRQLTKENIKEIKNLHREWFPIKYSDQLFESVLDPYNINYYVYGALYPYDNKEILLGCILVDFQPLEKKFRNHSSDEILEKMSKEISFYDEMNSTLTLSDYICAYIMTIGVIDECRRMHIGTKMIEHLVKKCLQIPLCICIFLDVVIYNNSAMQFYLKNNFEEVTIMKNFYHINNNVYDSKVFVRILGRKEKEEYRKKNWSRIYNFYEKFIAFPIYFLLLLLTFNIFCRCIRKKNKLD